MKAPFPYFGGKSSIAPIVWQALGNPARYIEPFFGSGAVLLNRPGWNPTDPFQNEIVNDKDGLLSNVWRGLQFAPDEVAKWCDWPVNHADLQARKAVLIREQESLVRMLLDDDGYFNAKLAGYWIWCASNWIGSGLMRPTQIPHLTSNKGVNSQRPPLTNNKGVNSKRPHLTNNNGVNSQRPHLTDNKGVNSQRPPLTNNHGVQDAYNDGTYTWFRQLSERLRYVKVVCGDWVRVCGGNWQDGEGICGMFFDPPYSHDVRDKTLYDTETDCARDVAKWAAERGKKPSYRIVLAGYLSEHEWLIKEGWTVHQWTAQGGYSNIGKKVKNGNRHREALFFSPHCNQAIMNLNIEAHQSALPKLLTADKDGFIYG